MAFTQGLCKNYGFSTTHFKVFGSLQNAETYAAVNPGSGLFKPTNTRFVVVTAVELFLEARDKRVSSKPWKCSCIFAKQSAASDLAWLRSVPNVFRYSFASLFSSSSVPVMERLLLPLPRMP